MDCDYCQDTKQIANGEGCPDCTKAAKDNGYYVGRIECPFCKKEQTNGSN